MTWAGLSREQLTERLQDLAEQAYEDKEKRLGGEMMRRIERLLMIEMVDHRWVRHLTDLDMLREGIGLQAYAQQDPLVAYKREAFEMFAELMDSIEEDVVTRIYHAELQPQQAAARRPVRAIHPVAGAGAGDSKPEPQHKSGPNVGRNDPCWCGSGKKYKDCHWSSDRAGTTQPDQPQPAGAKPGAKPGQPTPAAKAPPPRPAGAPGGKPAPRPPAAKTKKRR